MVLKLRFHFFVTAYIFLLFMKVVLQCSGSRISIAKFIQLPAEEQVNEVAHVYILHLISIYHANAARTEKLCGY